MVFLQRHFSRLVAQLTVLIVTAIPGGTAEAPKFYPDDPVSKAPAPVNVAKLPFRKTDLLFDFLYNSVGPFQPNQQIARGINTIGEVLDSEWYTNRHGLRRMSIEELQHGPGGMEPPVPPFEVTSGKTEGINPGFQMRDGKKRVFFMKFDPRRHPDLATAPDVIGTKFFYALGYNTPDNYILYVSPEDFSIASDAEFTGDNGKKRRMKRSDFARAIQDARRGKDRKIRFIASKLVPGHVIGPFRFEGTRSDDPNDVMPHEDRRDLRGLAIFAAWLNHTDTKAGNTLDAIVEENGIRFVKHFLLDFGSSLGSDSFAPKDARNGYEYFIDLDGKDFLKHALTLGAIVEPWESARYPRMRSVGRFGSKPFNPDKWLGNYPNRAFQNRLPDDEFWAAKQVMKFTNEEIHAIVETGQYRDPNDAQSIARILAERRDTIGRVIFEKVLPLDNIWLSNGQLEFDDLAVKYGFVGPRSYDISWSSFDNRTGQLTSISGAGAKLPTTTTSDCAAKISARGEDKKQVIVYIRKTGNDGKVVGIDRTW